jgi:hypothetical protein
MHRFDDRIAHGHRTTSTHESPSPSVPNSEDDSQQATRGARLPVPLHRLRWHIAVVQTYSGFGNDNAFPMVGSCGLFESVGLRLTTFKLRPDRTHAKFMQ